MRVFVACELAPSVRQGIAVLQDDWRASIPSARWVRAENLHLTLRFVGDVEERTVDALRSSLEIVARAAAPFRYSLRGGGCFPNPKRARVLWVGVDPVADALRSLQQAVERAVRDQGLPPDDRGFKPHLTIARFKTPPRSVAELIGRLGGLDFGGTKVSEIVLFESRLSPQGARYRAVGRFALGGTKREQLV